MIEGSRLVPSPESRDVLSLWSSQYQLDPDARDRMNAFLWNRGARGANVLSTILGGKYDVISGTSMSSRQMVNAAAKMLVLDPALTPAQLKGMLADISAQEPWL